jgi:hypothetical protein
MEDGMSWRRRQTQRDLFAGVGLPERFPPQVGRTLLMLLEALLREAARAAPVDGESGDDQDNA